MRLGFKKELLAVPEGPERDALFDRLLAAYRERGEALNMAATLEIDAVIDPARTRDWLVQHLNRVRVLEAAQPYVDTW